MTVLRRTNVIAGWVPVFLHYLFTIPLSTIFIFLILLPQLIIAQNITTIAGTGTGGYNGDGNATLSQLFGPQGLAMDASGNIYIADLVNSRVRKVDNMTGMISTIAGTGTPGYSGDGMLAINAKISNPSALAFDGNGDLYFTDRSNHCIRKINMSTGIITTVAGTGVSGYNNDGIAATTAQLSNPNEVAFDASGNLFIADWTNHRVRKVNKLTGIISTIAGTGAPGYNSDGILATTAQIDGPCGIIFDNAGNIYIAEYSGHRIRKIDISTGMISTFAGTATAGYNADGIPANTAQLSGCAYIKFDYQENMYIGDAGNQRIRRINASNGIISTVAGTGVGGYSSDGIPATTSQLYYPYAIYFDRPQCNMYIGDYANNRVRKVTGGFAGCIPLPLNLLSFTGKNKEDYNLLQWRAAGGINNDKFEIERSNDSRNFEVIGVVNGSGNSASTYSYSFIDQHPLNGINYYRLKQKSYDGTFVYSEVLTVTNRQAGNLSITIYPNPGNGQIRVASSATIEKMKISNLAGQIVYHAISKEKNISLQLYHTGVYIVQITTADQIITKKVTVLR